MKEYLNKPRYHSPIETQGTYHGPRFLQGEDPTCTAWAITHATLALGREPDPKQTASLLNATLPNEEKKGGLPLREVTRIINEQNFPIKGTIFSPGGVWENIKENSSKGEKIQSALRRVDEKTKIIGSIMIFDPSTMSPNPLHAICIDEVVDDGTSHILESAKRQCTYQYPELVKKLKLLVKR